MNKKLYICSFGMSLGQLTPETVAALKRSQAVFSHSLEEGPAAALLRRFCPDFRPLGGVGPVEIVRAVKTAYKKLDTAAFLTYGNPFFLNETSGLLKAELERAGVKVESLAAVSSFDLLVGMLGLNEPPAAGIRLLHAGLSAGEVAFYPEMACLVFMSDQLNRAKRPEHAGARGKFLAGIAAAYPPGHRVFIVKAPFMEDRRGSVIRTSVRGLSAALRRADRNSTLYIPAAVRALRAAR